MNTFTPNTPSMLPSSEPQYYFDDIPAQMAISQATRRYSRGTSTQRSGSAMRIVKPSSASNSPRSSTMANRRRTMMMEAMTPRRQQQQADYLYNTRCAPQQAGRPVSWHPSTYMQPRFQQMPSYPLSTPSMYNESPEVHMGQPQFSPLLTSYSSNTSPTSSFSPLPFGYQPGQTYYDGWSAPQKPQHLTVPEYTSAANTAPRPQGLDWNQFIMHGFNNTTPPTPELLSQQQPGSGENSPYEELEEVGDEGEILVGMGLYDPPEKDEDPQLNNYRSTVSSLLGSTFRPQEPKGKGLKLEETWEPPKSEDEEENDEESD